jgi:molybdopterin converting factor small subunit
MRPREARWAALRIELFGVARLRAGRARVEVDADTLDAALRALGRQCPGVEPDVVDAGRLTRHFLASLNGGPFLAGDENLGLRADDTLIIIGNQAGG